MRVAGVLLAAGRGTRFGAASKLFADLDGWPLMCWSAAALEEAGVTPRIAIVREEDVSAFEQVSAHLGPLGFDLLENPRADEGMGTSIAAGAVWALSQGVDAAVIALGDMPFVRPETYRAMIAAFERSGGTAIVMAEEGGRRGSPTLFPRALFGELAALEGDAGARGVVAAHEDLVVTVECATGELDDVDTPEALEAARRRLATR
jgi:molybdenum cofactor cytidylyltransferase